MCGGSKTITTIVVNSVAFNLNGPPATRQRFLPAQVIGGISRSVPSLGAAITGSLLEGPYVKYRSMVRYAKSSNYYAITGQATKTHGKIVSKEQADYINHYLEPNADTAIVMDMVRVVKDSPSLRAMRRQVGTRQTIIGTIGVKAGPANRFNTAQNLFWQEYFPESYYSMPNSYFGTDNIEDKWWLVVVYYKPTLTNTGSLVIGTVEGLEEGVPFPDVSTMWLQSDVTTNHTSNLTGTRTVTKQYSDGRPNEVANTTYSLGSVSYQDFTRSYKRTGYFNIKDDKYGFITRYYTLKQLNSVAVNSYTRIEEHFEGNVLVTTTTQVADQYLYASRSTKEDIQHKQLVTYGDHTLWEYGQGRGNSSLDQFINDVDYPEEFYPIVPIRRSNKRISDYSEELYKANKGLIKRGMGINYDRIEDGLEEHPDIQDIDHAYLVFGVTLNAKDNPCRRYLFHFFKYMYQISTSPLDFSMYPWEERYNYALVNGKPVPRISMWYVQPNWVTRPYPPAPNHWIWFKCPSFKLDLGISWKMSGFRYGSGKGWTGAKMGQVKTRILEKPNYMPYKDKWEASNSQDPATYTDRLNLMGFMQDPTTAAGSGGWGFYDSIYDKAPYNGYTNTPPISPYGVEYTSLGRTLDDIKSYGLDGGRTFVITYQKTNDHWEEIHIKDLYSVNKIYAGEEVRHNLKTAFSDDSDDSSFLIPLHEQVLKQLGFTDATEVCTQANYVLANCYEIHIQKVKKKGFLGFLISIIVAIIAITIAILAPELAPAMTSTFNLIGGALGFTGVAATIAGGVGSMIAGIIVTQAIVGITSALFGSKIGQILGSVLAAFTMAVGLGMAQGDSFLGAAQNLMTAENVIQTSLSVGKGVLDVMAQTEAEKLSRGFQALDRQQTSFWQEYMQKSRDLSDRFIDMFGSGASIGYFGGVPESSDMFISRTLLVGSDVAAITNGFITNYVESQLTLQPAIK